MRDDPSNPRQLQWITDILSTIILVGLVDESFDEVPESSLECLDEISVAKGDDIMVHGNGIVDDVFTLLNDNCLTWWWH